MFCAIPDSDIKRIMTDCHLIETEPGSGKWFCPDCDPERRRVLSVKAHRTCRNSRSRGLGDTIAKTTKRIGIKPCGGCKKRQAALNRMFPYRRKQKQ